jgi:hypothetical protein
VGIRVEVTQSEDEMLRIENDCEYGGHYDVQPLTPSSKTQAETGMDFRMNQPERLNLKINSRLPLFYANSLARRAPLQGQWAFIPRPVHPQVAGAYCDVDCGLAVFAQAVVSLY